jgi:hypothetical protein
MVPGSFFNSRGAGWQVFKTCHQKEVVRQHNTGLEGKIFFAARVYNSRVYSRDGPDGLFLVSGFSFYLPPACGRRTKDEGNDRDPLGGYSKKHC